MDDDFGCPRFGCWRSKTYSYLKDEMKGGFGCPRLRRRVTF